MKKGHCSSRARGREIQEERASHQRYGRPQLFIISFSFSSLVMPAVGSVCFPIHLTMDLVTDLLWPVECARHQVCHDWAEALNVVVCFDLCLSLWTFTKKLACLLQLWCQKKIHSAELSPGKPSWTKLSLLRPAEREPTIALKSCRQEINVDTSSPDLGLCVTTIKANK